MSDAGSPGWKYFVVFAASMAILSCGGSGSAPTGPGSETPSNVPSISSGTVVSMRSGETDQPVAGAVISLSGQSQAGMFSSTNTVRNRSGRRPR
jgi:hypothetical protein